MDERNDGFLTSAQGRRAVIVAVLTAIFGIVVWYLMPEDTSQWGPMSLVPPLFLLVYIFLTKRILEALAIAGFMTFAMLTGWNFITTYAYTLFDVLCDGDTVWLIIVCGLMGSIMCIIERGGGSMAFGNWVAKRAKSKKSALIWTWVLGIVIFIDDYMNSLTVGSCMAPITDKHRTSREMLSYVVDSTAAPLCVLIPVSTWAAFCSTLLESNGWAPEGEGLAYFCRTIPFNFYAWIAALIVPLVILGIIPLFGPMKKAEQRVRDGGPLAPAGSEKIDMKAGMEDVEITAKPKMINFFVPIIILIATTIAFEIDLMMGVVCTMIYLFIAYLVQGLMSPMEFIDLALQGIKNMILPLMFCILTFTFVWGLDDIYFSQYVIDLVSTFMTPAIMPVCIFVALACTEFITGSNWSIYIISLPIVIPLATQLDCNMALAVASVLSAGVFGSHVCFYSDATILTSAACGCDNFKHATSQAPFGLLAAAITAVLFLIMGIVMA